MLEQDLEKYITALRSKVPRMGIDIDKASPVYLLRAYLLLKRLYPKTPIEVFVSPSGVGFHLRLYKEVPLLEDILVRALIFGDEIRLVYTLKKFFLHPKETALDLMFSEKDGGKERHVDLAGMLEPYKREVAKIEKFLRNDNSEKADSLVKEVADKIKPQLEKYKRKQYVGCIAFNGDDLREKLEEICLNIMERDRTFSWRCYPCWFPEFDFIIAVFTDDKKLAWRRIVWLKNRARHNDKLILKDADTRLFVKERIAT